MTGPSRLRLEFSGEWYEPDPTVPFTIGRHGDLAIDDNPYLHRHFLQVEVNSQMWMLRNVGGRLSATFVDQRGHFQGLLRSGAFLPVIFGASFIRFGAGPTTYEVGVLLDDPPLEDLDPPVTDAEGTRTRGDVVLTQAQRLCIVALAEPALRRGVSGPSRLPKNREAAARLGWSEPQFNRKLDDVCAKLDRAGVQGLRGTDQDLATNRRARLVEYSLASRLVDPSDLSSLPGTSG